MSGIMKRISTAATLHTWRRNSEIFRFFTIQVTRWNYGMSTDVLGYLVEVVSGMPFAEFLKTRIFESRYVCSDTDFFGPRGKGGSLRNVI